MERTSCRPVELGVVAAVEMRKSNRRSSLYPLSSARRMPYASHSCSAAALAEREGVASGRVRARRRQPSRSRSVRRDVQSLPTLHSCPAARRWYGGTPPRKKGGGGERGGKGGAGGGKGGGEAHLGICEQYSHLLYGSVV